MQLETNRKDEKERQAWHVEVDTVVGRLPGSDQTESSCQHEIEAQ